MEGSRKRITQYSIWGFIGRRNTVQAKNGIKKYNKFKGHRYHFTDNHNLWFGMHSLCSSSCFQ